MNNMSIGSIKDSTSRLDLLGKFSAAVPNLPIEKLKSMLEAFASVFTQESRLLKLQIGDGEQFGDLLVPQSVEGAEHLSDCYKYEVTCLSPDAFIPVDSFLGLAAQLDITTDTGGLFDFDAPQEDVTRCGLITRAQALPSDGGFAKYRLTIEPPLALLRHRHTSRVFQDMNVPEIVEHILKEHIDTNQAIASILNLKPDLIQPHLHTARSYCLQYRESDLAFIERLLFEEGIGYRFEHEGGQTPLVSFIIFDTPLRLPQASQKSVCFHRADATEKEDSLTEWTHTRQIGSRRTSLNTYDYKPTQATETGADSHIGQGEEDIQAEASLEDYIAQTHYYGTDHDHLSYYARRRQEACDMQKGCFRAQGNVRQLKAGEWFVLAGHPNFDRFDYQGEKEFVVCSLTFRAHNNLPAELPQGSVLQAFSLPKAADDKPPPYWVNIEVRRRGLPLTPAYAHTRHARPTARDLQTATVTGPQGEEVYTDEMGRVKIQFHWQRQQEHPDFGANYDDRSSCWVRVGYPGAGVAWGHQSIPRIGQEVLVGFIEGDIDRPIIIAVIHNGKQPNPWFSGVGTLPANRALTGIKTKEHHGLQYGELLFDDTTDQVRTKLSSEHGKSQLNLGFLTHPRKDGAAEPRGDGFELRTDRSGAIRAQEGLLITTEAQPGATGKQLGREQAQDQLHAAREVVKVLAQAAEKQSADITETGPEERDEEGRKGNRSKAGHIEHMVEAIKAWEAGTNTDIKANDATEEQTGRQGTLLLSGAQGIGLVTPQELVLSSAENLDTVSQRDTQQTTVRRWIHNVGSRISLFVVGIADKFNLKLITAKGHAQLQAQSGDVEIIGKQNVRVYACEEKITIAAGKEILLTSGGAYIRIKDGGIEIHCPKKLSFKSDGHEFDGPTSLDEKLPGLPDGRLSKFESLNVQEFSG